MHKRDDVPSWSSVRVRKIIESIYGPEMRAQYQRENLGLNIDASRQIFPGAEVKSLFAKPRQSLQGISYKRIYVCLDPAGGSNIAEKRGSDFAVVSMVDPAMIVGAEAMDVTGFTAGQHTRVIIEVRALQGRLTHAPFSISRAC